MTEDLTPYAADREMCDIFAKRLRGTATLEDDSRLAYLQAYRRNRLFPLGTKGLTRRREVYK